LDWNSDEDNALDIDDDMGRRKSCFRPYIDVFGFHPYKEILFLCLSDSRVVAYIILMPQRFRIWESAALDIIIIP
jgi:hypothetical protein